MVFLCCRLIFYKLLYQCYCCWLACFLLSVPLSHIFSTSPEKSYLLFMMLNALNCKGYLLQQNSVETPPKQKADWTKATAAHIAHCFETGSWKYWKQWYLHQNFLQLCKKQCSPGHILWQALKWCNNDFRYRKQLAFFNDPFCRSHV